MTDHAAIVRDALDCGLPLLHREDRLARRAAAEAALIALVAEAQTNWQGWAEEHEKREAAEAERDEAQRALQAMEDHRIEREEQMDALADRCSRWEGKWHEAESALRREREVASSSLNSLLIRATEAEAKRDEARRQLCEDNHATKVRERILAAEAERDEARREIERLGQQMYYECVPKGEANKRIAEEQEISLRWAREANARAEAAEAERDRLGNLLAQEKSKPGGSFDQWARLQAAEAENARLREALEQIANTGNVATYSTFDPVSIARAALSGGSSE